MFIFVANFFLIFLNNVLSRVYDNKQNIFVQQKRNFGQNLASPIIQVTLLRPSYRSYLCGLCQQTSPALNGLPPVAPNFPYLNLPVLYLYWYTANQFILNGSEHARNVPVLAVQYSPFQTLSMNTQLPVNVRISTQDLWF